MTTIFTPIANRLQKLQIKFKQGAVCILKKRKSDILRPGTRGRNSSVVADKAYAKAHKGIKKGQTIYTGRAPKAILDLKAAIRYLRHFDKQMPGDAERIITDGTSAGGAMSALMGATGNNPEYAELLKAMGAADERDDVFASVLLSHHRPRTCRHGLRMALPADRLPPSAR